MKTTITLAVLLLLNLCFVLHANDLVVNNFEAESPVVSTKYGAAYSSAVNPLSSGLNTTATCGKISRTSGNWYELIYFPASFTVAANTKSYVHILVNYSAQPDISIRVDASSAGGDGTVDIRAMNKYTNFGQWQDLVFEIDGGANGKTCIQINYLGDLGFENSPALQVLNNSDKFGYIDEIIVNSSSVPRVATSTGLNDKNFSSIVYAQERNIIISPLDVCNVEIYNVSGKMVWKQNITSITTAKMDQAGVYFVKMGDKVSRIIVN